jgi:hypothetical protein
VAFGGLSGALGLGYFGDARRAAVGNKIMEQVVSLGTLVIRKFGLQRAGEKQAHRFLECGAVTCGEMVDTAAGCTAEACKDEDIVVIQDTTEINPRVKPEGKLFRAGGEPSWPWSGW